jgi:uncharacterized protein YlzI (FlbEa/FlbD family)
MRLIKVTRADGTSAFVNPQLVRAVVAAEKQMSFIQFDHDHVLMIRETAETVAKEIESAL